MESGLTQWLCLHGGSSLWSTVAHVALLHRLRCTLVTLQTSLAMSAGSYLFLVRSHILPPVHSLHPLRSASVA